MKRNDIIWKHIRYNDDTWRIIGAGAERDGTTYLHLASTTQFRQQRNGPYALQINDYIADDYIAANLVEVSQ